MNEIEIKLLKILNLMENAIDLLSDNNDLNCYELVCVKSCLGDVRHIAIGLLNKGDNLYV